ncbi:nuclear transport factor 2 family protein [Amycolatopsis sp. NEAU-NG30]|uniref:Nuclear transport factor 2 family protein n=1 Tax=Amycolatopsis melonis TaxID=3156488 RepID=A0ABV0L8E0_9PSEU
MAESASPVAVVEKYFAALAAKDFAGVAGLFADDIVWHQPGGHQFSGTHRGAASVGKLLGDMMTVSEGTFDLSVTGSPMANGALVAVPVHFSGRRAEAAMSQHGVDLLRIDGGRVAEVWLFSSDPQSEDEFWGAP